MLLDQINAAQRAKRIECEPFIYVATWNTLAGNATTPVNVAIQSDADFVLMKQHLVAYTGAGTLLVSPDYLIQFFDTGSGRNFQDAAVHIGNIMGPDAGHPWFWPEPKYVKGGSTLTVTLTNLTAVAARVDVALVGMKVYFLAGFNRDLLASV